MLGAPAFGKGFGGVSVVIGVSGIAAGVFLVIDPGSPTAIVSVLALIIFHLVLGWKAYSLSRGPVDSPGGSGRAVLFGDVNVEHQSARASEAARITEFMEETK